MKIIISILALLAAQNVFATGLKLVTIESGSVYEKMGLKSGDIIMEMNGKPVDSKDVEQLAQMFQKQGKMTLVIQRNGKSETYHYNFR